MDLRFFLFLILMISGLLSPASGETVRFCHADWPPYTSVDDGKVSGITVDIYRAALKRAGYQVEFIPIRWKRCLLSVRAGQYHGVADSARRDGFIQGPTFTAIFAQNIWVHLDNPAKAYTGPALLQNKRLGLVSGYVYPEEIKDDPAIFVDYAEMDETNLRKLAIKRIDMALSDLVNSRIFAQQHDLPIRPLTPVVSNNHLFPSFGPEYEIIQRDMEKALQRMVEDGSLDRIYQAHLGISFAALQKLAQPYQP